MLGCQLLTATALATESAGCSVDLGSAIAAAVERLPAAHLARAQHGLAREALAVTRRQRLPQWGPTLSTGVVRGDFGVSATTVDLGVPASWTAPFGTRVTAGPVVSMVDDETSMSFAGAIQQPLGRGLGRSPVREAIARAESDEARAEIALEQALAATRSAVVRAYYDYARSHARREAAAAIIARLEPDALLAEARQRAGVGDTSQRLQAQAQLRGAQEQLERFEELERSLYEALLIQLQIQPSEACEIVPPPLDLSFDGSLRELGARVVRHPESLGLRLDLEAADRNVALAEQNLKPQLDLVVGYSQVDVIEAGADAARFSRKGQWNVGLRGGLGSDRRQARLDLDRARLAREELALRVEQNERTLGSRIRLACDAVERARERTGLLASLRDDAESRVRLARLRLTHGLVEPRELIDAEEALQRVELQWVDARYDQAVAVFEARELLGEPETLAP